MDKVSAEVWSAEVDLPYGVKPRIMSDDGRLIAEVGNAEVDRQDKWEADATLLASAPRLYRCIYMAMGCLNAESSNPDERLAWLRLLDGIEGREPRGHL